MAILAAALFLVLAAVQVATTLSRTHDEQHDKMVAVMSDPASTRWMLTETGKPDGHAMAVAFLNEKDGMIVVGGKGLPDVRPGEVYVLWAIEKIAAATPRNLVAFRAGTYGAMAMVHDAPMPRDLVALAISVETDPRAKAPTAARIVASGGA
jgi:hypothetical protein